MIISIALPFVLFLIIAYAIVKVAKKKWDKATASELDEQIKKKAETNLALRRAAKEASKEKKDAKQSKGTIRDLLRVPNRLQELGCEVIECVVDVPQFDNKVEAMISARKDEAMKTELAKQTAIRAQQDALIAEEQGKANVATAQYEKEVEKVRAVTDARKSFGVAELQALQAKEDKKATIAKGQAEAEANRLKVAAGLTPQERAEWDFKTRVGVAKELSKVAMPSIVMGGSGSNESALDAVGIKFLMEINDKLAATK